MGFDTTMEIRLHRLEQDLSCSIKNGELPFIGHYANFLYDKAVDAIREEMQNAHDPMSFLYKSLVRWPAVFTTYLIRYVAVGYGERGTHEVYPFIEDAIQTNLTNSNKEKLWSWFRHACIKLGLTVSPRRSGTNYMVEEYLRQAGVPLRYVGDLAEKMYSYANDVGVPDDDDPAAIRLWQAGLKAKVRYLAKPVQKALGADDEGFYTRMFVRLFGGGAQQDESLSDIEGLFLQRIGELKSRETGHNGNCQTIKIPQFIFRDGQLGVELPPGEDEIWRFDVDGIIESHSGSLEKRFVPFDSFLPQRVSISQARGSTQVAKEFWPDEKNNRFLVFSATGGLICKGQLGQADGILLEPGEFDLLLRFFPSNLEDHCEHLCDDPTLALYHLILDPDQTFELTRGPAKAVFKADTKPSLTWTGQKYRGVLGNELYASSGLHLEIKVPEELYAEGAADYELRLNPGGLGKEVVLVLPRQKLIAVDLSPHLDVWAPGLARVLVELRRQGFQRPESRSSIFCWNGLLEVKNRTHFICSKLPSEENLLWGDSDNLKIDTDKKIVTFRNDDQRVFRMVFLLPGGRRQLFTWAVPGVFMQILDFQEGQAVEKPLKKVQPFRSPPVLGRFSKYSRVAMG